MRRAPRISAAILIAMFLGLGLLNLKNYGQTFDENNALARGDATARIISSVFFGGPAVSDSDIAMLHGLLHPSFFSMLYSQASKWALAYGADCIVAKHMLIVVTGALGLVFLYMLIEPVFGGWTAVFAVMLLALYPRFIAHSQFNPKDAPFLSFSVMAMYFFNRALTRKTMGAVLASAAAFAVALTTHLNALLLLPVFLTGIAVESRIGPATFRGKKKAMNQILVWTTASLLGTFALWPLLWFRPASATDMLIKVSTTSFADVNVMYFGKFYRGFDLPWHYTLFSFFMATPVVTNVLAMLGAFATRTGSLLPERRRMIAMLPVWLLLPVALQSIPGTLRYDGMRHIFMAVPPLVIYAAIGLASIETEGLRGALAMATGALLFFEVFTIHPFECSYMNQIVRAVYPSKLEDHFSMETWGCCIRQGMEWLNANAEQGALIVAKHGYLAGCIRRPDLVVNPDGIGDYEMFLAGEHEQRGTHQGRTPVFTVSRNHSSLLYIFRKGQ